MHFEETSPCALLKSTSRVYTDVFRNTPDSYFEHEAYNLATDNIENFSLIKKIGQGKYSLVFDGMYQSEPVVVKMLKPIKKHKIKREIKILEHLKHGTNIIQLFTTVTIPSGMHALVFKTTPDNEDFRNIYMKLGDHDIRYYTFEILKALDFCHSKGIMHRDVKPHNIIIDKKSRKLQLIDFGLAEFYRPEERYNVRVASRHYKGPELLVDYGYYDYSLDLWSLGCVFASMIFRKEPFFQGIDNRNQLCCICKVLGTTKLHTYLKKYEITLDSAFHVMLGAHSRKPWQRFVNTENEHLVNVFAFELLDWLLCYDHNLRCTAKEAMQNSYFLNLKP